MNRRLLVLSLSVLAPPAFSACSIEATPAAPEVVLEESPHALSSPQARAGAILFERAFANTNGRSCATCHVVNEHTTLLPASVQARLAANPKDPLFHPIDADDPAATPLAFEHLKKGLVRVVLQMPDNMDVIDAGGLVITPADRKIFVWRGVPTVENVGMGGPFQYDGREATLESQAQGAITSHSQGPKVAAADLKAIAAFQRSVFSSLRAGFVATLIELGIPLRDIPVPEKHAHFSAQERRGQEIYRKACEPCHGGATTGEITDRRVVDGLFFELKRDGNVVFTKAPDGTPIPVQRAHPNAKFFNVGFGVASYLGQVGILPTFNASVALPRYRFRFYSDGTRTEAVTDLPPIPRTASGDPLDLTPALDADGAPIVGSNFLPQLFTTDAGRALITGDPRDYEAFDVPQLRGIARTAPYFHDNSHATLRDAVGFYSQFVLPFFPTLNLPANLPPETPGGAPESLSPADKADLLAFLERL